MAVERLNDWRRPGCGDDCREAWVLTAGLKGRQRVEIHDPEAHETWGASPSGAPAFMLTAAHPHMVATGPMTVTFGSAEVKVDGRSIAVSATEWRILEMLARHPGQWVRFETVIDTVWDDGDYSASSRKRIGAHLWRLRGRLGPAANAIVTWPSIGLMLRMIPPGDNYLARRWAQQFDCCQQCGTTETPFEGRGLCMACFRRARDRRR